MIKKLCNLISTLLLILLLAVAVVIVLPMAFGYKEMAVLSGSMEPTIPVGSLIYVKPCAAEDLEVGDVCTFQINGGTYVTHRVMQMDDETKTLVTKGDANDAEDGALPYSSVVGEAQFHLPWLGYISMNIKTPKGILAVCGVLVLVILSNFIPAIIEADEEEKAAGGQPAKAGKHSK